jgi:hypothetical protein
MATAWADPDHQLWAFGEDEYRQAVRDYLRGDRPS